MISGGDVGGAKTHVHTLLSGLAKTEEVLLACFMEGPFAREAEELGIPTRVFTGSIPAVVRQLTELVRDGGYELIHCHGARANLVGSLLKNFYLKGNKELIASIPSSHCLFGLHLLREEEIGMKEDGRLPTVAVVEAEKTAVIMSEVFPQYLWMATGGLSNLNEYALFPLRHHRVILFPDTDPSGKTYGAWYAVAQRASRLMGCTLTVSALLEQKATREQKQRKIDLVDYYFEP
jgi:hypothetical protein